MLLQVVSVQICICQCGNYENLNPNNWKTALFTVKITILTQSLPQYIQKGESHILLFLYRMKSPHF